MKRGCLVCGWCLLSTAWLWGRGGDVFSPGQSLVVESLPPIDAELAEKASRYTEFRSADLFVMVPANPTTDKLLV